MTNHTADPKTLEETLDAVEQEPDAAFDFKEWGLPSAFTDEVMAAMALEHLKTVQVCEVNIISNKAVHNDAEVNRLVQLQGASKRALQEIRRSHPNVIPIVRELATQQASSIRDSRKRSVEAGR